MTYSLHIATSALEAAADAADTALAMSRSMRDARLAVETGIREDGQNCLLLVAEHASDVPVFVAALAADQADALDVEFLHFVATLSTGCAIEARPDGLVAAKFVDVLPQYGDAPSVWRWY
ncbi:hypothetical protein [Prescottella equi]|uniref:hypothetical protein n=1 Tax=Rhodococcus hoagii TaxID=43767 RepID=UPI000D0FCF21|nr:hypothetical protein [Prescottella equi]AVP71329.1 hypothetical protein C7H75_24925 [Prescottella equi]